MFVGSKCYSPMSKTNIHKIEKMFDVFINIKVHFFEFESEIKRSVSRYSNTQDENKGKKGTEVHTPSPKTIHPMKIS